MKILYVANDRRTAQIAADAFRTIAHDVTVAWAGSLSAAQDWVSGNRDVSAVVVEAEVQNQHCAPFVGHVRALGLTAPVIVVASEHLRTPLAALRAGADDYVVDSPALLTDLPVIVRRSLQRAQPDAPAPDRDGDALIQAAIEHERAQRQTLEVKLAEATAGLAQVTRDRDESVSLQNALNYRLTVVEAARQQVERHASSEQAAAAHLQADLEARLAEQNAMRIVLAQKVADLEAAAEERGAFQQMLLTALAGLQQSERRRESEAAVAADDMARRSAEFADSIAEVATSRDALARQLHDAAAALDEVRQTRAADAAAAADHLARREAELGAMLAASIAARDRLERQLADAKAARQLADERATVDRVAAARRLTEVEALLADEVALRAVLEESLAGAEAAHRAAAERYTSELSAAAAHLAQRQAEHETRLAQAAAAHEALEEQLRERTSALDRAHHERTEEATAAAEYVARREAELGAMLADAMAMQNSLQQQLEDSQAMLREAEQHAAQRAADFDARLAQETAARGRLEEALAGAEAAHRAASERYTSELSAAAAHLAERQAEHEARLAHAAASHAALEEQLRERTSALELAQHERAAEATAAAERLTRREAELGAMLADAMATQNSLEQRLADAQATHREAEQHAAQRAADLDARLAQETAARGRLEEALAGAEAAHRAAEERSASELSAAAAQLAERQAEHEARLAQAAASHEALEEQLRERTSALELAQQQGAAEASAAAEHVARREAELGAMLTEAAATRDTLERRLADAEAARQLADEGATRERDAHARVLGEAQQERQHHQREREALQRALDAAQEQLRRLNEALAAERESHDRDRTTAEDERLRAAAEYAELQRMLETVRVEFHAAARASSEHAAEAARLGGVVVDRDVQLREVTARHLASQHAAKDALTEIEGKLHLAVESGNREVARLQTELEALGRELEGTRTERDALRTVAERVPHLQHQLDQTQAEFRGHVEHTPYGICRAGRDGTIMHANRAMVRLLGYRTADELQRVDFASTVFAAEDDLGWLIERCLATGTSETLEATWRRKDRSRRMVRLLAFPAAPESVDIIAEDVTDLRATEERLRQAQRMEAVGRLAPEVAVTCENLLRDVSTECRQWLATIGGDTASRRRGELLLGELTRTAGFLEQLAVYGQQQTSALEPVDVNQVLRGLVPVLERVAGDDIEFVLPKTSPPVIVDVAVERVERVLVNVASYARERMPSGGRLKIELATTMVGREFLAKYPNVRSGAHALITVTEENVAKPSGWRHTHPTELVETDAHTPRSGKPGVDLGVLLGLIGDCGGHLWMAAEPPGNMVLRIHLPQRISDALADPPTPTTRSAGGGVMARLFGH